MTSFTSTADPAEIERFSRIAEEWWDESGKFKPLHRMNAARMGYLRDQICAHFGKNPLSPRPLAGLTILDIGCGGGLLCEPLTRLGATVTGIDAAERNINTASLHAEQMGLTITYKTATPETLLADASRFDVVLAMEIVEHVADVPVFLHACAALIASGGMICMSTLNRTAKSYALAIIGAEYVMRWLPRGTHQWSKFVKPSELCAGLRKEGLAIKQMSGMVFHPLQNSWQLDERDLSVNYLLSATL